MEYPDVEVMLDREMPHTRHKGLPQRSIIGPSRKHFVDRRIVDGRLALGVVRDGQALPLHARVEHPQNEVEDAMIAQFTLGSPLGQREVGQVNAVNSGAESWTELASLQAVRLWCSFCMGLI